MMRILSAAIRYSPVLGVLLLAMRSTLGAENFSGKTVVSIAYEPPLQPADARDLANMQLVRTGEPLDPTQVAGTIDRIFASGLYEDVQVDAEPRGSGVALRFITRPRRFIGHVGAQGDIKDPPNRAAIVAHTQLHLGTPFDEDDLVTAKKTLEHELRQNGLYEATVGVATTEDPDTHQVTVRFLVEAGKRAKYEMPVIEGDTKLSDQTIVKATGWRFPFIRRWRKVTAALTDSGVEGVQKKYAKVGRLTASVDLTSLDYNPATVRAKPTLDIDAGPKITIRALEAKVSKGKLRKYVPVYEEGTVNNDLLTEGARNLHDYFQSKGYPDVDVTFRAEPLKDDQQVINYYIATGPRRKLVKVEILGSNYFDLDTIRERMFLRPATLVLRYGRYSEDFRKKDEEAIENLYRANGFRDVKVASKVVTDYKGNANDIAVVFQINQGAQWKVANLEITGISQLDLSPIRNQFASAEGQPYADVNIAADRALLLDYYYSHGFPNASFRSETEPGRDAKSVNVLYEITEGQREFVREVIISGLNRTKPSLVQQRIKINPGEPVSMVKINNIARQFSDLGIFANVNTALQDPDGKTQYKNVLYDFDEAARYTFNVGFGLELGQFGGTTTNLTEAGGAKGVSPIVSFNVNRLNFLGRGQTVSLQTRYSTLEQRESLNYIIPHFLGSYSRTFTASALYDTTQNVQTFSSRRLEGSVQVAQRLNRASTILMQFAYRRVSTGNIVIPALLIPFYSQPVRIGELSASYIQDHRDNPADAHRGFWNTVNGGLAGKFLGSQRDFYRVLARNATYTSIGRNLVFARQTQFGTIIPFNLPLGTLAFDAIPLPERFFGGGSFSMRGFGDNQAGPRDIGTPTELPGLATATPTGFPIGGNALFFNTFELRFPLLFPNLSGAVFNDMGNIFTTMNDMSFAYHQSTAQQCFTVNNQGQVTNRFACDFNYTVQAAGFGLRYKTPLGPVRVDLAYALNPPRYFGFSTNESIQTLIQCGTGPNKIPIGTPPCNPGPQRLSHFQFSFSIGQAF